MMTIFEQNEAPAEMDIWNLVMHALGARFEYKLLREHAVIYTINY
jgi:hypothetical protein